MALSVADQLTQLEAARQLVLADAVLYPQIVQGILPIVGANARVELRRWGAEFLAETFASPTLALQQKERLSVVVLQTLKELLEIPGEDGSVVKSVVQAAASIYGLVFRYIIANPHDSPTWDKMATIKLNILKRWDTASTGIRTCCIKFVQKVVQVQTPGVIADPRRPEQNEISLALVPRDHPLIPPPNLEPEASGLLDRMLNVFHEDTSDAVLVTATLNCLGTLIRTRQTIANKIIQAILSFNPLKQTNSPMTPKAKVQIKSMERTTRAVLMNIYRRNETGPFAPRIKQYVDRLLQARMDIFDEARGKRALPSEPTDGLDSAKRIRLGAEVPNRLNPPPLPPGPTSVAQLFTLTSDEGLSSFDVTQLPIDLVVKITLPVLHQINQASLDEAINSVRLRYTSLSRSQYSATQSQVIASTNPEEDEDDYEPDFQPMEDAEQILNKADALPPEGPLQTPTEVALGPFKLPQPPPLTTEESLQIGKSTVSRVFGTMNALDETASTRRQKPGLNRLAGSNYDREAWITVITRLATRASAGLQSDDDTDDDLSKELINQQNSKMSLSDSIRENLWKYIIEDFRARIHIAIAWLNEEWFNDRIQAQAKSQSQDSKFPSSLPQENYEKWVLKVLDIIIPYLDAKDKLLIRFMSEIPSVDETILGRVKGLAKDPERVVLAVNAIHYLILVRPPVRGICLDAIEDLWRNYDDAKIPTTKILTKWRPNILKPDIKKSITETNGIKPTPSSDSEAINNNPIIL